MKIHLRCQEDAFEVAELMKQAGYNKPAAVGIKYTDVPHLEWWAVSDPETLSTLSGYVEQIRIF